eukprot:TRINITY_DN32786_c0_g1_i1.p1 TRINITY_DN32786_c0_g1~~TRINITY_DN32786_c0_g1_i1.p1  ORF type:complete len:474 (-),score=69.83 TRINITY_DN32786_c0_g1_i1:25-1446(-)
MSSTQPRAGFQRALSNGAPYEALRHAGDMGRRDGQGYVAAASLVAESTAQSEAYVVSEQQASAERNRNARLAAWKAFSILQKMDMHGALGSRGRDSLYGAAVALPQVARSAGWPKTLVATTIRACASLVISMALQAYLVSLIQWDTVVAQPLAGKMHLCDFGAFLHQCPGAPTCKGPGGTDVTAARLQNFETWASRSFVRDALVELFPNLRHDIFNKVDPGEYGLESYGCRLVFVFIFMMDVMSDLMNSFGLIVTLWRLPSKSETWLNYEGPDVFQEDVETRVRGSRELDRVRFQVAGMTGAWKMTTMLLIVMPKVALWWYLTSVGFHFLMETAGIVDVAVNAMVMMFILRIDDVMLSLLGTEVSRHIMRNLHEGQLAFGSERDETDAEALARLEQKERFSFAVLVDLRFYFMLVPLRLAMVIAMMLLFLANYYASNCYVDGDGAWVSKDVHASQDVPAANLTGQLSSTFPLP